MTAREAQVGDVAAPVTDEQQQFDALRAENYAVIGALLAAPPSADLLARLAAVVPEGTLDSPLDRAWRELASAAREADAEAVHEEYQTLFIGIGRGELLPFGSWYLTGFLMEQPLTVLRNDLQRLGFARREGVHEPEDHIAALYEVMVMLITDPERAVDYTQQRTFFETHLAPFQGRFWNDLAAAGSARFYVAVGRLGASFGELELGYFSLPT